MAKTSMGTVLCLLAVFTAAGCAASKSKTGIRPIGDNYTLARGEGLVILGGWACKEFEITFRVADLPKRLSEGVTFDEQEMRGHTITVPMWKTTDRFLIIPLRADRYAFTSATTQSVGYDLRESKSFEVRAGKATYIGHMELSGDGKSLTFRVWDLEQLITEDYFKKYPNISSQCVFRKALLK